MHSGRLPPPACRTRSSRLGPTPSLSCARPPLSPPTLQNYSAAAGACGYGDLPAAAWPFAATAAIDPAASPFAGGVQQGCGVCLQVTEPPPAAAAPPCGAQHLRSPPSFVRASRMRPPPLCAMLAAGGVHRPRLLRQRQPAPHRAGLRLLRRLRRLHRVPVALRLWPDRGQLAGEGRRALPAGTVAVGQAWCLCLCVGGGGWRGAGGDRWSQDRGSLEEYP